MSISITLSGADAAEWLRVRTERTARERRKDAAPPTLEDLERQILNALPCDYRKLYERAGIARPWRRAGHALRRLRASGRVEYDRGTIREVKR